MLLLNTRSRPTWLAPTLIDDGPKTPDAAWFPVTTRSRPIVSGGRPLPAHLPAEPDSEIDRPVGDTQVACDLQVAQAVEHEREVGGALDREVVPDLHRALRRVPPHPARSAPSVRLRGEEVVADGRQPHVHPPPETEQQHVVHDGDSPRSKPELLAARDEVVPDGRPDHVGARLRLRPRRCRGRRSSRRSLRRRRHRSDVVADARARHVRAGSSSRIRSCVIVAPSPRSSRPRGRSGS